MKKIFFGAFLSILYALAWGQSSRSISPPPPPPNPAAITNTSAQQFLIIHNNLMPTKSIVSPNSGPGFLNDPVFTINTSASNNANNPTGSIFPPKSFESSIQGLQFIKPSSVK